MNQLTLTSSNRFKYLIVALGLVILTASSGCHRGYYRRQADAEAMRLIESKTTSPHWQLEDYSLEARPDSRMYQPFSLDHPPMPPDDPYSHQLMHYVDEKPGFPLWHANGDTWYTENPEWRNYLALNEDGELELNMQTALQTALVHSRFYQRQQEELYLSALDVSVERFNFDSQLFLGYDGFFTSDGPDRDGSGNASNTLAGSTGPRGVRLEKLGIAGSALVVGFANTLLWEFTGADTQTANTLIDFSLIQPLLRGAGRDRIMEGLTAAERTLLANVRQLERFRRGFMLDITTGRGAGAGVARGGQFIGLDFGGGVGGASGLIGLLRDLQDIQIQESNVAALRSFLNQFREYNQVGRVDQLQVQQSESALYEAQDRLLRSLIDYQTNLDSFKIELGLPPDLPVKIDDPMLDRFEFFDADTTDIQNRITDLQSSAGVTIIRIEDRRRVLLEPAVSDNRITDTTTDALYWSDADTEDLIALKRLVADARDLNRRILEETIPRARFDSESLRQSLDRRLENIRLLRTKMEEAGADGGYVVEPEIFDEERLIQGPSQRESETVTLETAFQQIEMELIAIDQSLDLYIEFGSSLPPIELYRLLYSEVLKQVPKQLTELSGRFLELSLVLVRARTDTISRTPIEISPELAIEIARRNRRDWMNARADLVDAWRQIEFAADDLESSFDLVFEGDLSNKGDNPIRLRGTTGRLRAGFQFDAPFTRLIERNTYREILINYDRTRRSYYAYEDEVYRSLREIIRNLERNKVSFELSRRSILVAVAQVELARFNLIRPPRPGAERDSLGATTARDLTDALARLQGAQLSFLNVWVDYEVLRRTLDFELGTLQLDGTGMWVDPGPVTEESAQLMLEQSIYSEDQVAPSWEELSLYPEFDDEIMNYPADGPIEGAAPFEEIDPFEQMQFVPPAEDAANLVPVPQARVVHPMDRLRRERSEAAGIRQVDFQFGPMAPGEMQPLMPPSGETQPRVGGPVAGLRIPQFGREVK